MKIIPLAVPTPFYIGDVNVYLIKEEPLTLIDTGPKTAAAADALRLKLKQNGANFADIKRIVLTHAHEDHCGLAKQIRDESVDAEIYIHPWESGHLFGEINVAAQENLLIRAGVPEKVFGELEAIYKNAALFTDALSRSELRELKDEMEIEFASGVLKVWHTPGHTPGSCSFFREANRTLLAGDTILKRLTPNPIIAPDPFDKTRRFHSLGEYLVSLAKIKTHAPTLIHGGHFEPITDFAEVFQRYVRAVDERQKQIVALISSEGATAFEIAGKLFPDATGFHKFLAVSEAVAHLDYAETENKIAVEIKGAAEIYRKL